MAAQEKKLAGINLVPKDEFEKSVFGKALGWALTAGRSIVILTEFVVILAFLSRFKLDRDLNDLNEVVTQKQAVVESYVEIEETMRDIQARLAVAEKGEGDTVGVREELAQLTEKTPFDVRFDSIEIGSGNLRLEGVAGSEGGFAKIVEEVRADEQYSEVRLEEIKFDQRKGGILFVLSAKEEKERPTVASREEDRDE